MKREIKFRAFSRIFNECKMFYDVGILSKEDGQWFTFNENNRIYQSGDRVAIMQFTGLTDKNGKEIYDGDIISNKLIKGFVVFDSGCFCIKVVCIINKDAGYDVGSCPALFDFIYNEIIGNIYENPELLQS